MTRLLAHSIVTAALALAACGSEPEGFVRGPELTLQRCASLTEGRTFAPFERDLVFMAVERDGAAMTVMFAADSRIVPPPDVLVMSSSDVFGLRDAVAAGTEVTLGTDNTDLLTLSLALQDSCPLATQSLVGHGTATFSAFGWDAGDRIAGSLSFDLSDARTGEPVATGLTAGFDFEVTTGLPHTVFIDGNEQGY